jgi:hypothetical protein
VHQSTGFLDGDKYQSVLPVSDELEQKEISINGVRVYSTSQMKISIPISKCSTLKTTDVITLIDCGAEGKFVDSSIVDWSKVKCLKNPIPVRNVDGTLNKAGAIQFKVQM